MHKNNNDVDKQSRTHTNQMFTYATFSNIMTIKIIKVIQRSHICPKGTIQEV